MLDPSWKADLIDALERRDAAALTHIPKADLHCHVLLSAPRAAYAQLLGRELPPVPDVFGAFSAFVEYIGTHLLPALSGPDAVRAIVRATFEHMVADGVVYAEPSFDLLLPDFINVSPAALAEMVAEECARVADRTTIAPEIGIARGYPPDELLPRLRQWLASGAWRSIDLYDDENLGTLADFAPLYRLAADHGLKLKAHAGELRGAEAVRESVEVLQLNSVQHGVRAAEDPAVMDFLAERGTLLHVCPTSNYSLGVCPTLEDHPARRLHGHGVRLTVNTDDYTLFGASASGELLNLLRMGFSPGEIAQLVDNGLAERR